MSVRIVVDSTADFPQAVRERVTVVPLTIHFGEEEYIDGVTIDHNAFYEKLVQSPVLPTTSQATPEVFQKYFREAHEAGDTLVLITLASQLSGTCQSALIAAEDYEGEVFVVDSQSVTIGAGILAARAVELMDQGLEAGEIAHRLIQERENVRIVAVLDTLEYLKRGGRISKTVAFAGGLLSIKPVVGVQDGVVGMLGKARGTRQGIDALLREIDNAGGIDQSRPALLGYTGVSDALLQNFIQACAAQENPIAELPATAIGSVVGTHVGPGAYAVAFFKN